MQTREKICWRNFLRTRGETGLINTRKVGLEVIDV